MDVMDDYQVHSTRYLEEIKQVHNIFKKKRELEKQIVDLILQFERDTGVAIDIVKYERDITIPMHHKSYYTDLKIVVSSDKDEASE